MSGTTARLSLPYPGGGDGPDGADVPYWMQELAVALDGAALDDQGVLASRPVSTPGSPGIKGRYYMVVGDPAAANNGILWRDNGTGWDAITNDELAYNEITAAVNVTGGSSGAATPVIPGTAHVYDGTPVMAEFYSPAVHPPNIAGSFMFLGLYDGATCVAVLAHLENPTNSNVNTALIGKRRFSPPAGAHTYNVQGWVTSTTGTPFVGAGDAIGGDDVPAYFRITRVN